MKIIFDLDGTLIDSSDRMYQLFVKLIPECRFTKEEYWKLKRNKINHRMIIERYFPETDYIDFNSTWLRMIELSEYLNMDQNYPDTIETLSALKTRNDLILLTARQSRENLSRELDRLKLKGYFSSIFVTEAMRSKEDLLLDINNSHDDIFVSDMGKDIFAGNNHGYITVGISHGFMCGEKLMEYEPTYCIDELKQLLTLIERI